MVVRFFGSSWYPFLACFQSEAEGRNTMLEGPLKQDTPIYRLQHPVLGATTSL